MTPLRSLLRPLLRSLLRLSRVSPRVAVALALLLLTAPLRADEVKIGGIWQPGVRVLEIAEEQLVYRNAVGLELSQPMASVEGVRLDAYPMLRAADEALAAGNPGEAIKQLTQLRTQAGRDKLAWLTNYATQRLMLLQQAQGEHAAAALSFLLLAQAEAERAYLAKPPVESLKALEGQELARVLDQYRSTQPRLRGDARAIVAQIITVLEQRVAPAQEPQTPVDPGQPPQPVKPELLEAIVGPAAPAESAVVLPRATPANDPIAPMLREGRFEEAIAELDKTINGSGGRLAMRLYQRGVARLALAEVTGDRDGLLDAGLDFARVVFYFPSVSQWQGPSLVELAHIHRRLGEDAVALDLFDRATGVIDDEDEPEYAARLDQLRGGETP